MRGYSSRFKITFKENAGDPGRTLDTGAGQEPWG